MKYMHYETLMYIHIIVLKLESMSKEIILTNFTPSKRYISTVEL